MTDHPTLCVGSFFHKAEDLMHLNNVAFHAPDLVDADEPPPAIGKALELHNERDCGCDLTADARHWQPDPGHCHHLLQSLERIARRVSVDCGHRAFMASIHGLQHV